MLSPARRRELGAFYTPPDVADGLMAIALAGMPGSAVVCDPACGDGAFLLAAGRALAARGLAAESIAAELLWGCDLDANAVGAARAAIRAWSGVDPGEHFVVGDGLTLGARWPARFDAVVGNPPFLNQLERATTRRETLPTRLQGLAAPYTDTAWLFLPAALDLKRDGGRVVLMQPQSVLAARDATSVRDVLRDQLEGIWWSDEPLFDASVRVCAVVLGPANGRVKRWCGRAAAPIDDAQRPDGPTWGSLINVHAPAVDISIERGTLAALASATAGFRDQFYGLAPHVRDEPAGELPLLVTSGLIDVGRIRWGERTTRLAGVRYQHPRVNVDALEPSLMRWVRDRLQPKVVLATQTKVLEAAVDVKGEWVPSTPVIAVHPHDVDDLWRVAAVLVAPPVSAWAARAYAGAALAPRAIKLSAKQALGIPLPVDDHAWAAAAGELERGDIDAAAEAMTSAYRSPPEVFDWWKWLGERSTVGHH